MRSRAAHLVLLACAFATVLRAGDAEAQSGSSSRAERIRALKIERTDATLAVQATAAKSPLSKTVDCTKGQSIQAAIDQADGPVVIDVRGVCQENVLIERKTVTLRGLDPASDGIQGIVASPAARAALQIRFADAVIENLSISNGPSSGVRVDSSSVTMENCNLEGNAFSGLVVATSGFAVCRACNLASNGGAAAQASSGGFLTLHDSTVTGGSGLRAFSEGSYADIDCATSITTHPCTLNVTGLAAAAFGGGTAALWSAGDFTGRVRAADRAHVYFFGARQVSLSGINSIEQFSTLLAEPDVQQSLLLQTNLSYFSRAVLLDQTELGGNLTCASAADAWLDPSVVKGSNTVSGCEHVVVGP